MSDVFLSLKLETPGTFTLELNEGGGVITTLTTFDYFDPSKVQYNAFVPYGSTLEAIPVVIDSGDDDVMDDDIPYDVKVSAKNSGSQPIWILHNLAPNGRLVKVAPGMSYELEFSSEFYSDYTFVNNVKEY
jgi:hypothetical protein